MKKILVSALVALMAIFAVVPVQAGIFKWGIEGGINMSKMKISKSALEANNRSGWFAGVKAQVTIPLLGLGIDGAVLYSQKYMDVEKAMVGTSLTGQPYYYMGTESKSMPYFELPINIKYNIGFSSVIGAYISTGPQWSYYMGGKTFTFEDGTIGSFKDTNFSWNIGLGINAIKHLQLGVTYNIPIGKTGEVKEMNAWDVTKALDMKNNTWQVRLAYMF